MEFLHLQEAEKFNKQKCIQFWWTPCKFFDPSAPSMRKGDDGGETGKKKREKKKENNDENSGH